MNRILVFLLFILPLKLVGQSPYFNEIPFLFNENNYKLNCLANDTAGYLYIGTNKGVFYFDGYNFNKLGIEVKNELNVKKLFFDHQNNLWIGDELGNVYLKKNESASLLKVHKFKAGVSDMLQDQFHNIWLSSLGDGIICVKPDLSLQKCPTLTDNYVYDLLLVGEQVWIATDNRINIINNKTFKQIEFKQNKNITDEIVTYLSYNNKYNFITIGTQSKGMFIYSIPQNKIEHIINSENFGAINKIINDKNETWLLTEDSSLVHYLHEGAYKIYNKKNTKFISGISDAIVDNEGNFWLCNKTSSLYSFNNLFEYLAFPNQQINSCNAIYRDTHNRLWFSTKNELYYYDNAKFTKVFSSEKNISIVSIHEDEYGNIWAGTFDKGLIKINLQTNKHVFYTNKNGLSNNNILSIASVKNILWLATLGGICKIEFSTENDKLISVTNFEKEKSIGINFIYQVFVDSKNRIWFATDGKGLTMYDGSTFHNYNKTNGLKSKTIYSITEDKNGKIWFSTLNDGIYSFNGKEFKNFNRLNGIRSLTISGLVCDNFNNMLIISDIGIDVFNTSTYQVLYHDDEIGLKNIKPTLNANCKDSYQYIWIGTANGIIKYYTQLNSMWNGPSTILKQVNVFSKKIDITKAAHFKADENYFVFEFVGLWYHKPSEVKYRVQLEGYDLKWYDTKDNKLTYSKLPPGNYVFKVMSSASNDFTYAKITSYKFEIDHPFWQKNWFILLASILLIFGIYVFVNWRTKGLQEKQQFENDRIRFQLETLRNQINPHFLFNSFNTLAGIIETNPDKAILFVEKLSDFYRELLTYREKNLINLSEELKLLENYIFLIEQRFLGKIKFELQIPLDLFSKKIAPLSLQLLIENAIKHNTASREDPLIIKIFADQNYLVVQNEILRKSSGVISTGIGLQNIVKRYELLSDMKVEIIDNQQIFIVKVPLID